MTWPFPGDRVTLLWAGIRSPPVISAIELLRRMVLLPAPVST